MPAEVLAECIAAFHKKAAEILQEQGDTEYLLRGEISSLLARVETDLRAFVDDHVHLFTRRIGEVFERLTSRFVERANRIIAEIRSLAADLFDVRITPIIEVESFTTESSQYYYVDDLFMLQLARLPLLLPGSLAKRYIRRQFVGSCRTQLDLNAGRLRSDFQARLQKSARAFSASFNGKVKATLDDLEDTLRRAAEEKQRSEVQLEAMQRRLEADRAAVADILALMEQS